MLCFQTESVSKRVDNVVSTTKLWMQMVSRVKVNKRLSRKHLQKNNENQTSNKKNKKNLKEQPNIKCLPQELFQI